MMVGGTPTTDAVVTPAQNTAQTHPNPLVEAFKRAVAVLKVRKPADERAIDVRDDDREAVPAGAARLLPHRVFEFHQTLRPWPAMPAFEVVSEEVKATGALHIHEMRFLGVQLQAGRLRPAAHERQRLLSVLCCATQDDEVVGD